MTKEKNAKLIIDGKTYILPIISGSEKNEFGIDIRNLRKETGLTTYDPGLANTSSCQSEITYMNGKQGILRYRGIPIEVLAEKSTFVETAFLLFYGRLPNGKELKRMWDKLTEHSLLHEDMKIFFQHFPRSAHPMGILTGMLNTLPTFYPEIKGDDLSELDEVFPFIMSKLRTIAAMSYRISRGDKVVYPKSYHSYCANFLYMMFDSPIAPYEPDEDMVAILNKFLILHGDHEQNCSTSSVRFVGSGKVNVFAAVSAGMSALWGPLHGGANQAVISMLEEIAQNKISIESAVKRAKDKNDPYRLMGFGHRIYTTYDPRAKIMKKLCKDILKKVKKKDPLLDVAQKIEEIALTDPYFIDRNLYPNVDFYSGIILRAMGIPLNMFTVMFAIGRLPGWVSQWKESLEDKDWKLCRPRQIYTGAKETEYISVDKRKW